MAFTLPSAAVLARRAGPHLSRETLELHHGKHHQTYVDKLNDLVEGKSNDDLEAVILEADAGTGLQQRRPALEPLLLLAVHGARTAAASPSGELAEAIDATSGPSTPSRKKLARSRRDALRLGLGVAGARRLEAPRHEHPRRRPAPRRTASRRC